ncbi:hypothetical protein [Paenibacillus sophorae]|uniref:Uncharacterized protein n=1 Tax=Paenibacillus sophorae TaxID=1333845 RepID=A0ABX8HBH8_9BACL|nr:hypothetical protein [Paenibacillus sophorae]QWU15299.1 hypothetical protein KP014_26015 [Paenibacillus sophorae]
MALIFLKEREDSAAHAKNVNILRDQPGITLTGFASDAGMGILKAGIGVDRSKITEKQLEADVMSLLTGAASFVNKKSR